MKGRESIQRERVITADGQLAITVIEQAAPQQTRIYLEIVPAKPSFDRNLPKVGCDAA